MATVAALVTGPAGVMQVGEEDAGERHGEVDRGDVCNVQAEEPVWCVVEVAAAGSGSATDSYSTT